MNTLKRAITIVGIITAVLVLALIGLALYALNRKNENAQKIAPAMAGRWKPKDEKTTQANEEPNHSPEMVVSPNDNGVNHSGSGVVV